VLRSNKLDLIQLYIDYTDNKHIEPDTVSRYCM
jgi:hypothetical protein